MFNSVAAIYKSLQRNLVLKPWLSVFSASTLTFLVLIPFSRLDFDNHHDGFVVATAIGMASGLEQYKSVYSQYGVITPLFQSHLVDIGATPALNLRILNVVFIAVAVGALVNITKFNSKFWTINPFVVNLAALTWVLTNDAIYGVAMLPWNSTLFAAYQVIYLNFIAVLIKHLSSNRRMHKVIVPLFIGIFTPLSIFIRINSGLLMFCLTFSVFTLAYFSKSLTLMRSRLRWIFAGISVASVGFLLFFLFQGTLTDYWSQGIVLPSKTILSETMLFNWDPISQIVYYMQLGVCLSALSFLLLHFVNPLVTILLEKVAVRTITFLSFALSLNLLMIACVLLLLLRMGLIRTITLILGTLAGILLLNVLLWFSRFVFESIRDKSAREISIKNFKDFLLISLSVSGFAQIFPTTDTRHIWWGIPLALVFIFEKIFLFLSHYYSSLLKLGLPIVITSLISLSLFAGIKTLSAPRSKVEFGVAREMLVNQTLYNQLAQEYSLLKNHKAYTQRAKYLCVDGYYSVFDGNYNASDRWFVDWSLLPGWSIPVVSSEPNSKEARSLVFCGTPEQASLYATKINGRIIVKSSTVSIILR